MTGVQRSGSLVTFLLLTGLWIPLAGVRSLGEALEPRRGDGEGMERDAAPCGPCIVVLCREGLRRSVRGTQVSPGFPSLRTKTLGC